MNSPLENILRIDSTWLIQTSLDAWTPPVGLARLCHWPDLNDIPDDIVICVARILALLGSKPTATHLINRRLVGEREETYRALQALEAMGHIEFISVSSPDSNSAERFPTEETHEPSKLSGVGSFMGKLRQRLLG